MAIEFDTLSALTLGATTRDVRYLVDESGFYGQTFVATSSRLTTVEFAIDASTVGIATTFSVMVATVRYDSLGFHPNAVIYESPLIREVADTDSVWSLISVNTNGIVLNPGEMYVILFNANAGNDDEMGSIRFAVKPTNDAGFFVYRNNPVTDQDTATIFNRAWSAEPANGATRSWGDIAMRLTYGAANTAPGLPVDADGSGDTGGANATIAEDLAVGSAIGLTAASVDVDGDTVTYSFGLDGNGQSKLNEGPFAIDAASGVVTLAAQLDYETTGSYTLTVVASDGTVSSHSNFQVNVTNVAPTAAQDSGSATEAGTQAGAAASGNVLGNDVEVGNPANKSVSAVAHGAAPGVVGASLAGDYGTLTLNADGSYGYVVNDANPAVNALGAYADTLIDSFTYTVQDSAGGRSSTTLAITVHGANDAPDAPADADGSGDTGGANATIAEDLAVGSAIGLTAASVDVDGDTVTYSFGLDGSGQPKLIEGPFAIDAASGVVTLAAQLDYETTGSYTLTVVASDGTVSSHSNFQVNVTNVAPVAAQDSGSATEAGTQAGAAASGNVLGNDVEVGNPANKSVSAVAHGAATGVVGASLAGDYGTLTLNADGSYGYVVNDENPAVNALGAYADTLIELVYLYRPGQRRGQLQHHPRHHCPRCQ